VFLSNIKLLCRLRGLRQSDLARKAGITRQAVSLWFRKGRRGEVPVRSDHLVRLCQALEIGIDDLMTPLPESDDLEASLLWDRLYPDVFALVAAASSGEPRALARLVQVHGLLVTARLFGRRVIGDFHRYKRYIHPTRREQCEQVCKTIKNPPSH
jgi:transcriptional regulator with XRE-family HTH domain